jgi:tetratricopeptide (TPR) repeat protein
MHAQFEQFGRALVHARQHARESGDLALEIDIVTRSGAPLVMGPLPVEEGLRYVEEILDDMGEIPAVQLCALHIQGHLRARLGQFEGAREAMARWRQQLRELGQEVKYGSAASCEADVCSLAEDWEGAERVLRDGYEILERIRERSGLCTIAAHLGDALYRQERLDEAERYSEVSEELGASDDYFNEVAWRTLRAKVLEARGALESAEAFIREAVEIAGRTDCLDLQAGASLDLAEILRASGRLEQAREAVEAAVVLYEQKGNLVGAAKANALRTELGGDR